MGTQWLKWNKGGTWQDNDEGYHMRYCPVCMKSTEHDLRICIPCINRKMSKKT
jgi:hypothetical protein